MSEAPHQDEWHALSAQEVVRYYEIDIARGLSPKEVVAGAMRYGKNVIERTHTYTLFDRIVAQLKSPLVVILIIAAAATVLLGHYTDAIVIAIALLINIIAGVLQEERASQAFEKLVQSQDRFATVIRDGEKRSVAIHDLVPGDVVVVEPGSYVGADMRIIESKGITVDESTLTGEWEPVEKITETMEREARVSERRNMLWRGTLVTAGTGTAIVVAIGKDTQLGRIAEHLEGKEDSIPLQRNMQRIARFLSIMVLCILVVVFIAGVWRGYDTIDMVLMAIAIAVAVMPEGLPAAVTVVLAVGMESILKKGGLVRNLLAAETLGNTTVILTDKTGTLTKAEMRVADVFTERAIADHGMPAKRTLRDAFIKNDKKDVLSMAIMTADAYVEGTATPMNEWVVRGRPVERAFVLAGLESSLYQKDLLKEEPRLDYLPFESERRFVASLHHIGGVRSKRRRVYLAGSPELFLEAATYVYSEGKKKKMPQYVREALREIQEAESANGMRMVAVGYADVKWDTFPSQLLKHPTLDAFGELVFGGLVSLRDPLREDVRESIAIARQAGVTVYMATGDNPVTALAIARESGIVDEKEQVCTGAQIEEMDDDTLVRTLETTRVFARVLPVQKMRIANLLKGRGEVVAMTGDGINDAPALRKADIGISLGSGTDVAKEASDLVLLNDSFTIIVDAIREGRRIRTNLKKIVTYLLSTSFSDLAVVIGALVAGAQLPILPSQILWINIIEEGFMNFAFAFEPSEEGSMKRDPRSDAMRKILTKELLTLIAVIATVTGVILIALYYYLLSLHMSIEQVRTIIFIALSVDSIFFAFSIKNLHRPIWHINLFSNMYLVVALLLSVTGLIAALVFDPLRSLLRLEPLTGEGFALMLAIGLVNLLIIEAAKFIVFRNRE